MKYYKEVRKRLDAYQHVIVMEKRRWRSDKERGTFRIYNSGFLAHIAADDLMVDLAVADRKKLEEKEIELSQMGLIIQQYKDAHGK